MKDVPFAGGQTYEEAIAYIEGKFRDVNKNKKKTIYVHYTCATDTNQLRSVIDASLNLVIDTYIQNGGTRVA